MQTSKVFAFLVGVLLFAFSSLTSAEELFEFDSNEESVDWQLDPKKTENAIAEEKSEASEGVPEEAIELSEELDDEDPDRIIPSGDSSHDNEVEHLEANAVPNKDNQRWYDEELKGLHESRKRRLQQRISSLERDQSEYEQDLFKENMSDPNVHFRVALTHQSRGDAEGAIIHMQKAETLYKNQKNLRGMARSRKALRKYYKAYGYLPEDFDIAR